MNLFRMQQRLLVVLAHPDDETFICGGTLAKYAQAGVTITYLCATRGEMGRQIGSPPFATRETLPIIREQELRQACRHLGISDLRLMGYRDKTLDYYPPGEIADRITAVMAEVQPHAVITFHEVLGGHPDHCAIGRATRLAFEQAGLAPECRLYYLLWSGDPERLKPIGASEQQITRVSIPSGAVRAKVAAYRAHRSQSERSERSEWLWQDATALERLRRPEFFLQGSGPVRPGERELLI